MSVEAAKAAFHPQATRIHRSTSGWGIIVFRLRSTRWLVLAVWFVLGLGSAHAMDWREAVTPWDDPLKTRPPVLEQGARLPGDQIAQPCASWTTYQQPSEGLTLVDVLDLGLCANPQVQGAWARIKVQAAALGEVRASYLPTLSAGISRLNDRTSYPGSALNSTSVEGTAKNMGLSWRLFDFGGRAANSASATALLDAAMASHNAVLQKMLETLIGAFFDAQTARASWEAKQQGEALARSTLKTAQRREGRGAGAQTDTLQAITAVAKASLDTSRARGDYQKTLAMLVYAMGLPSAAQLHLRPDVEDAHQILAQDLQAWLEQTQQAHPAIVAAQRQLEAARQKIIATQSEGLPSIDLGINEYQNGRPTQGLSTIQTRERVASMTLNIPLFEGFSRTYKVRGAQAQVEQSEASLQDTTHQVLMNVVKTYADARAALGNLDASNLLLRSARNALQSVQRKFDRGASDIVEMLGAQSALADALAQRIRCQAEWRSARLRLLASSGILGRSALDR